MRCLSCFSIRLSIFPHLTKATVSISPSVTYLVIRSTRLLLVCWIARQNMRSKNVAAETFQCLVSFISQDSHCLIKSCVTEQFPAVHVLERQETVKNKRLYFSFLKQQQQKYKRMTTSITKHRKIFQTWSGSNACTPCAWLVGQKHFSARVRWLLFTPREKML